MPLPAPAPRRAPPPESVEDPFAAPAAGAPYPLAGPAATSSPDPFAAALGGPAASGGVATAARAPAKPRLTSRPPPPVPEDPFALSSAPPDDPFAAATLARRPAAIPPPEDDPFLSTPTDPFAVGPEIDLPRPSPAPRRAPPAPSCALDAVDAPAPDVERSLAADGGRAAPASRYDGMDVSALALDVAEGPAAASPAAGLPSERPTAAFDLVAAPAPRPARASAPAPVTARGGPGSPPLAPGASAADSPSSAAGPRPSRAPSPRPEPTVIAPPLPPPRAGLWRSAAMNALSLAALLGLAVTLFLAGRGRTVHAGPSDAAPFSVSGVTGGLYDTAGGALVLVVRGRVTARAAVAGPVRVDVQLVERDGVVAAAAGVAGGAATPEEVHAAGDATAVERLRDALQLRAAPQLGAGESAPFVVVFPPPAPDPLRVEVRVTPRAD